MICSETRSLIYMFVPGLVPGKIESSHTPRGINPSLCLWRQAELRYQLRRLGLAGRSERQTQHHLGAGGSRPLEQLYKDLFTHRLLGLVR